MKKEYFERLFKENDHFALNKDIDIYNESKKKRHPFSKKGFKATLVINDDFDNEITFTSLEDLYNYKHDDKTIAEIVEEAKEFYYQRERFVNA